jgi:hypothetical protein
MLQIATADTLPIVTPTITPYRIFISHSAIDRPWVEWIEQNARGVGIHAYLFEHDPQPGTYISTKVKQQIAECDAVVVLLTASSAQSAYVQQEIGFAEASGKLIIPLMQQGLDPRCLAMLAGREYIPFDFRDPNAGLQPLLASLIKKHAIKQTETANRNLMLLVFATVLVLGLLNGK